MVCPVCNTRKAKRTCPALSRQICTMCCGTKRIVEIHCPADCPYLAAARTHPPAVVQRQQELDRSLLLPLLHGLSERQARLFLMFGAVAARHQGDALQKPHDDDIAQAAGALASTLETAGRGIVYEHQPASLPAARLLSDLKAMLDDVMKNAGTALERDAAVALRRLEQGAQSVARGQADTNELQLLLQRVLAPASGTPSEAIVADRPALIIPPAV
jgi:hypothetical protein